MKYTSFKFLSVMISAFVVIISCHSQHDTFNKEIEKQLVEKAIHNSIGWAKNKDINLLYSVIANDTNYIEVDPNDRVIKGFQDFKKAEDFWMSDNFKAIKYEIRDLTINLPHTIRE